MVESRRTRLRRELTEQILDVARRQLGERGPSGVSWRGIAREVGMNPASLYTYFDGMDGLYTALILQGFHSLAEAVRVASAATAEDEPLDQLLACAGAYRAWAVENPGHFNLIFSDQIPGYAAPPNGPTVAAERAVIQPLMQAAGRLEGRLYDVAGFKELPIEDQDRHLTMFGLLHGLVSLEVNHHLPPDIDHGARLEHRLRQGIDAWARAGRQIEV